MRIYAMTPDTQDVITKTQAMAMFDDVLDLLGNDPDAFVHAHVFGYPSLNTSPQLMDKQLVVSMKPNRQTLISLVKDKILEIVNTDFDDIHSGYSVDFVLNTDRLGFGKFGITLLVGSDQYPMLKHDDPYRRTQVIKFLTSNNSIDDVLNGLDYETCVYPMAESVITERLNENPYHLHRQAQEEVVLDNNPTT